MKTKTNGLSCPLHPYQIFSWVYISYHVFTNAYMFSSQSELFLFFLSVPLFVSQLTLIITAVVCTLADPTDEYSKMYTYDSRNDHLFEAMCIQCNTFVRPDSKHCSECKRCAHKFDHHCKWFNNCIAEANYRAFIYSILALEINLTISFILEFIIVQDAPQELVAIIIVDLMFSSVILILNTNLIGFHLYLYCKNMTTYEYILARRKNKNKSKVYAQVKQEDEIEKIEMTLNVHKAAEEALKNIQRAEARSCNHREAIDPPSIRLNTK